MKLQITLLASNHLLAAYDYLHTSSPAAAKSQLTHIFNAIDRLKQYPFSGRKGRIEGTRELVVPRTPFIVAYAVATDEVQILAVLHAAQQWPESFQSLPP
jgi:plasmid stabilization system protein ParE